MMAASDDREQLAGGQAWTFIHARTESGDDYYITTPGVLADDEVSRVLDEHLGDEAEFVYHLHVESTPAASGEGSDCG